MKRTFTLLSLGLLAATATAAQAADWNKGAGGLKDHGGPAGIPVPAPIPVIESFSWYLRADLGYAFKSQGSATTHTFLGLTTSQDYDLNDGPFLGTLGFGRYLTNTIRWDLTGDYRGTQRVRGGAPLSYTAQTFTEGPQVTVGGNTVTSTQINTFAVTRNEEVRMANHTFLANLYYDFNRGGGFNPYLGVGAGITGRESRLEFTETSACVYTENSLGAPPGQQPCREQGTTRSGKPTNFNWGPAAALMAGFTYEVHPGILLDTGYRLSWQGGHSSIKPPGTGDLITGDSRTDHEVRAGLRWNVW